MSALNYATTDWGLLQDLKASKEYAAILLRIHDETDVDVAIMWGIGSRESRWGRILKPAGAHGTGDFARRNGELPPDGRGWGRGLMQIDYRAHGFARMGNWMDPEANIRYAIKDVLLANLMYFQRRFPDLDAEGQRRAAIAGYNCGPGTVRKVILAGADPDKFTAHGNYSADVLARAIWFKRGGGFQRETSA